MRVLKCNIDKYRNTNLNIELTNFINERGINEADIISVQEVCSSKHMFFDDAKKESYSPYVYTIYVRDV